MLHIVNLQARTRK